MSIATGSPVLGQKALGCRSGSETAIPLRPQALVSLKIEHTVTQNVCEGVRAFDSCHAARRRRLCLFCQIG